MSTTTVLAPDAPPSSSSSSSPSAATSVTSLSPPQAQPLQPQLQTPSLYRSASTSSMLARARGQGPAAKLHMALATSIPFIIGISLVGLIALSIAAAAVANGTPPIDHAPDGSSTVPFEPVNPCGKHAAASVLHVASLLVFLLGSLCNFFLYTYAIYGMMLVVIASFVYGLVALLGDPAPHIPPCSAQSPLSTTLTFGWVLLLGALMLLVTGMWISTAVRSQQQQLDEYATQEVLPSGIPKSLRAGLGGGATATTTTRPRDVEAEAADAVVTRGVAVRFAVAAPGEDVEADELSQRAGARTA
ncbi:hypothetical protein BC828DRAFT_376707 [Blastocladiella britannica]|nr:hypothetical protein BC828DRAFT_376707 [Blastocladiella britannica]